MNRRSLDRGHWIVAAGACILIIAAVLNWWQDEAIGVGTLPPNSSGPGLMNDGRVLLIFLVALAALMLIALPFAAETPVPIDRTASYLVLLMVGLIAFVWRVLDIVLPGGRTLFPTAAPGVWLAAIGLVVFARGVFEIHETGRPRW